MVQSINRSTEIRRYFALYWASVCFLHVHAYGERAWSLSDPCLASECPCPVLKDAYGEGGAVSLALHHFLSPDSRDDIKLVAVRTLAHRHCVCPSLYFIISTSPAMVGTRAPPPAPHAALCLTSTCCDALCSGGQLRILAVVCEGHSANQAKFRREGGPHALVEALNVYTRKRAHVRPQRGGYRLHH